MPFSHTKHCWDRTMQTCASTHLLFVFFFLSWICFQAQWGQCREISMSRHPHQEKVSCGSGRMTTVHGPPTTWRSAWLSRMPMRNSTPGLTWPLWASATSSISTACLRPTSRASASGAYGDAWTWPTRSSWAPSPSRSRGPWEPVLASPAPANSAS